MGEETENLAPSAREDWTFDHVSNSQIKLYRDCPRKWFYQYPMGVKVAPSDALKYGRAAHEDVENYLTDPAHEPEMAELKHALDNDLFPIAGAGREQTDVIVLGIELELAGEIELADIPLNGYVDATWLVDLPEGFELVVTDWKFRSSIRSSEEDVRENLQLNLYAAALLERFEAYSFDRIRLQHVEFQKSHKGGPDCERTAAYVDREQIDSVVHEAEHTVFEMRDYVESNIVHVPQNLDSCWKYGQCEHFEACHAVPHEIEQPLLDNEDDTMSDDKTALPVDKMIDSKGSRSANDGESDSSETSDEAAARVDDDLDSVPEDTEDDLDELADSGEPASGSVTSIDDHEKSVSDLLGKYKSAKLNPAGDDFDPREHVDSVEQLLAFREGFETEFGEDTFSEAFPDAAEELAVDDSAREVSEELESRGIERPPEEIRSWLGTAANAVLLAEPAEDVADRLEAELDHPDGTRQHGSNDGDDWPVLPEPPEEGEAVEFADNVLDEYRDKAASPVKSFELSDYDWTIERLSAFAELYEDQYGDGTFVEAFEPVEVATTPAPAPDGSIPQVNDGDDEPAEPTDGPTDANFCPPDQEPPREPDEPADLSVDDVDWTEAENVGDGTAETIERELVEDHNIKSVEQLRGNGFDFEVISGVGPTTADNLGELVDGLDNFAPEDSDSDSDDGDESVRSLNAKIGKAREIVAETAGAEWDSDAINEHEARKCGDAETIADLMVKRTGEPAETDGTVDDGDQKRVDPEKLHDIKSLVESRNDTAFEAGVLEPSELREESVEYCVHAYEKRQGLRPEQQSEAEAGAESEAGSEPSPVDKSGGDGSQLVLYVNCAPIGGDEIEGEDYHLLDRFLRSRGFYEDAVDFVEENHDDALGGEYWDAPQYAKGGKALAGAVQRRIGEFRGKTFVIDTGSPGADRVLNLLSGQASKIVRGF